MAGKEDTSTHPVVLAINNQLQRDQESGDRRHLGGSLIGRSCRRALWYSFRWATEKPLSGKMLRLFNRGHREEDRFIEWLRASGATIMQYDEPDYVLAIHDPTGSYCLFSRVEWEFMHANGKSPNEPLIEVTGDDAHTLLARRSGVDIPAPKQIRILDVDGHFGGSLDGIGFNLPGVLQELGFDPREPGLTEFKTHNEKSFEKLLTDRLRKAKPEHWYQMQTYMFKKGLRYGLYLAIDKNTDRLYAEFVLCEPEVGRTMIEKAREIVYSKVPPRRPFSNSTGFDCTYCDHKQACWFKQALKKNCRTCVNAAPAQDGKWYCGMWSAFIPPDAEKAGCDRWAEIKGD